mgnify:CR=1 FL=1
MKIPIIWVGVSALALHAVPAVAQDHSQMDHAQHSAAPTPNAGPVDHSKMDHAKMGHDMAAMPAATSGNPAEGSGTSRLPGNEGGMHGIHLPVAKDWMVRRMAMSGASPPTSRDHVATTRHMCSRWLC